MFRRYKYETSLFLFFILVYLAQSFLVEPDKSTLTKYHLSSGGAKTVTLTVVVPYIIIWIIALAGYLRLRHYAELIHGSKDGMAFALIARGLLWFSLWLPLNTIVSGMFAKYYGAHPDSTANLVRLNSYFNLLILTPAFYYVYIGSCKLLPIVRQSRSAVSQFAMYGYIAFASLYTLLVLHDPARHHPTAVVKVASYYEPDWLIVVTIIIPRLIMWYVGVQAVQNIYLYRRKVKGSLYKIALNMLAQGLSVTIGVAIILRCVQSLSAPLASASLALLLLIVYTLLIIIAAGYVLIAKGASHLQKLEEL